ncbi:NlpC/P60 family protein [Massilimicrobiota timonensis]|uniref:NlpC/P60 family protein n=1 Tax=Massilimicrobiota timonensis TaxID=1776392 RepID=A0ABT7UI59_9FIRM|nr:C40 family peptidase [Massilimicrobiota timonensis]MDM8195617.1 NlpC/P60 family protein [Massilimicrobiota timonensis]
MKKLGISFLAFCSVFAMSLFPIDVHATDFEGQEDKYIKICSSNLTNSNKKVCQEFNKYLKEKNQDLKEEIQDTKDDLSETNDNIDEVSKKIETLNSQIDEKNKEIDYMLKSIEKIKKDIAKKEEQMRERLYVMQTTYNSNWVLDFLFGSEDFSTFFSRIGSVNDITAYEKELVEELTQQKQNLDTQQKSLETAKENLESQKKSQEALQEKYIELKTAQQEKIKDSQQESKEVSSAQKKIDAALSELISRAPSGGGGGGSYVPGDSAVGNAIAQKALTRLGCRYWWGANGPNYFDCSGLVYWAYNQAGVSLGRTTAAGYASSGKAISRSELQPGDVITFSYGSGVAHIGIYIGGGSFVHASGEGSGTVGQYPDQCVKTAPLSGYWERYVYNYRRLY